MTIHLIWAQAHHGVIGANGRIPWRVPEDLARFKSLTSGGAVIMGRKTWDSLPGSVRPLSERTNLVVTRQPDWRAPGAIRAASIDDALSASSGLERWIIGGAEVYAAAIASAESLEVTEVDLDVDGDAVAPIISARWEKMRTEPAEGWMLSSTGIPYRFVSYRRMRPEPS